MQSHSYLPIFLLLAISNFVSGSERCVWAVGMLRCESNPIKHFGVQVWIMDEDPGMDDIMASALTAMDGSFELTGCANDINLMG
ncbi:transthyretin-like family domain-containing protein [Ditylenchus destructor]|nr:transthyretin-like family domain-containing protein [Ditylenchus destructor]